MTIENSKKLIKSFTNDAKQGALFHAAAKLSKLHDYLVASDVPATTVEFIIDSTMTALNDGDIFDAVDHFTYGAFLARRRSSDAKVAAYKAQA